MKIRRWLWLFISIGLIMPLATPALCQATSVEPLSEQGTLVTTRLRDASSKANETPNATAYWTLTVTVNNSDLGYVIAYGEEESKRTMNGWLQETYTYKEGASVILEARANAGAEFDYWSGDLGEGGYGVVYGESRDNPLEVTSMYSDIQIMAHFIDLHQLSVNSTEGGSVSPKEGLQYYRPGHKMALTAKPGPGFIFAMWTGDTDSAQFSGDQITFTMGSDRSITAVFLEIPQVDPGPIVTFPWATLPLDKLEPSLFIDPEDHKIFLPPSLQGETLPEGFLNPWLDWGPPGESFNDPVPGEYLEDTEGGLFMNGRNFPWDSPPEINPEPDLDQPRQTGEGEKPAGKLPDPDVRKLEVIVSRGDMGAVEVKYTAYKGIRYGFRNAKIDIGELPIKPASGPGETWQSSMAFSWLIRPYQPIQLTAKPFEGYRFVSWIIDEFTLLEAADTIEAMLLMQPIIYNPENPVLTIPELRGDLTLHAYFAPIVPGTSPPEDTLPQEGDEDTEAEIGPITVNLSTTSETIEDESGCSSIVTIDYEAIDTIGGSNPISDVQLDVNGERYGSWSGTPTDHYQEDALMESGCSEVHVIQLTATNDDGQTKITTKEAKIPPLSTHFTYGFLDAPGDGDCQMQLIINYQAVDLGTPENPITNVVVKANEGTWHNSGSISSLWYEKSFGELVGCGHIYRIEVIGTDADGNKYIYRETINIPEEEPTDEPPPPPPPPPPQTTLYAALAASAQCTASGPECSCQLSISFDGKDSTVGDYPVKQVILKVNGTEWYNSGPITETHHHNSVTRTVDCG